MTQFKQGDKVKLKKEFWKERVWTRGGCARSYRKNIAALMGEYTVKDLLLGIYGRNLTFAEDTGLLHVPADCFELVEKPIVEVKEVYLGISTEGIPSGCMMYLNPKTGHIRTSRVGTDPAKSKAFVAAVTKSYEKPMRKWTEAEITEAKCIVYDCTFVKDIVLGFKDVSGEPFKVVLKNGKTFTSKPCPTDEPNEHIGRMIVLCKATGRPFPDWIKKGTV